MATRRAKAKGLRQHRSYSVEEAARAMSVCTGTVRRWIKTGTIIPIDQNRPTLLSGFDLVAISKPQKGQKVKSQQNEAFCFSCRAIRPMAFNEAEIASANHSGANLRALCSVCAGVMHKRVSLKAFPALASVLSISGTQAHLHLINTNQPRINDDFKDHPCTIIKRTDADEGGG